MKAGRAPRPWQNAAADAARFALYDPSGPGWKSGLIVAATGVGKGDAIPGLAVSHALKGGRCMIVVDRKELVNDVAKRAREVAIHHGLTDATGRPRVGVVMANRNETKNPIVVASIQSVSQPDRLAQVGKVSLLITDEAHGATAPSHIALHAAIAEKYPNWRHLGFTATGFRGDGNEGLGTVYEGEVFTYGIQEAIAAGDLVPFEDWAVPTEVSVADIPMNASGDDYNEAALAKEINVEARNRLAWQKYIEYAKGKPALMFCVDVKHANDLAEMGRKEFGVNAQAVHGTTKAYPLAPIECEKRIRRYKETPEALPVLCSCDLIRVGFDAPKTYAVMMLRPTKSLVVFMQAFGRGTRTVGVPEHLTDPAAKRAAIAASSKPKMVYIQLVDAGCEMTLSHATNLTKQNPEEKEGRALDVGDEVARRRHLDWGNGVIQQIVAEDSPLGRLVTVLWPISVAHPAGGLKEHPIRDLQRPPAPVEDDGEDEVERATISVNGGPAYRLGLLPGERAEDPGAIGWYDHNGTWTVSAAVSGIGRIRMHVRIGPKGWEVWSLRPPIAAKGETGSDDIATMRRDDCDTKETAMAWANSHIRSNGAIVAPLMADWKGNPATAGQIGMLRGKYGIRRDLSSMCAGEASALIDACAASERVGDILDPKRAQRRDFVRAQYRGRKARDSS